MLPVVILAKYYSNAQSAVSERPNSSARLVFERSVLQSRQAYSPAYLKQSFIPTCYVFPHKTGTSHFVSNDGATAKLCKLACHAPCLHEKTPVIGLNHLS